MITSLVKQFYLQTHHLTSMGNESCIATLWNVSLVLKLRQVPSPRGPAVGNKLVREYTETVGLLT